MIEWYKIVGLIGVTLIFTSAYIFDNVRHFAASLNRHLGIFVACSMCIGFWVGFLYCKFFRPEIHLIEKILFGGCISILAYVTDTLIIFIERLTSVLLQKSAILRTTQNNREQQPGNDPKDDQFPKV